MKWYKKTICFLVICAMVLGLCPSFGVHVRAEEGPRQSIRISENGFINDEPSAPKFFKIEGGALVEGTKEDYQLHYEPETKTMELKDFVFRNDSDSVICADCDLNLVLTGTSEITSGSGPAMVIGNEVRKTGSLNISGAGSLEVVCESPKKVNGEGENITPPACVVQGTSFTNKSTLICKSDNSDIDLAMWNASITTVKNTGTVKGRFGAGKEETYIGGDGMVPCDTQYAAPTDHDYIGKAYYFTSDTFYPNNLVDTMNEGDWRVVGKYDENGAPIPSKIYYQYIYVDKRGAVVTEDFENQTMYLVYDENPAALLSDKDVAAVADGKTYTFNADLYAVWFSSGNITVNGNVILDCACFEEAMTKDGDETRTQYERDQQGNIVFRSDSTGSKIVINGNTGFLSLNKSYKGDVTINGDVSGSAAYDDVNVKDGEEPAENFYAAIPSAGKVMENGKLLINFKELQGYVDTAVYEDSCYVLTERKIDGEDVKGTSMAVNGDSLLVDVSADGIGALTYPLVRPSDLALTEKIEGLLSDTDSKLTCMDISLIEDNTKEVEPTKEVKLYIQDLEDFEEPALFHIKDDGTIEKLFVGLKDDFQGDIICSTGSFSTYFVAENQELKKASINDTNKPEDTNKETEVVVKAENTYKTEVSGKVLTSDMKISQDAVAETSDTYKKAVSSVEKYGSKALIEADYMKVYEFNLTKSGTAVHQLTDYVEVSFQAPEDFKLAADEKAVVYRVEDEGTLTLCETTVVNGVIKFKTNHFSTYILAKEKVVTKPTETVAPTTTPASTPKTENVKTGDETNITPWMYLIFLGMMIIGAGVGYCVFTNKKNRVR